MEWNYFSKIYCISLEERADRRRQAATEFEKVGLAGRVEFVIVAKHPNNCEQGIFQSHRQCIRKGLEANAQTIVVFEDDVVFDNFKPQQLHNCIQFMETHRPWSVFFWGCLVNGSQKTAYPSVLKIKYRTLAHAYVINHPFAQIIARQKWQGVAYDDLLHGYQENMYAVYPGFAFQSNSPSDNVNYIGLDRFRRLCGGLKRLQKMNERYHYHKRTIIAAHIIVMGWLFYLLWF